MLTQSLLLAVLSSLAVFAAVAGLYVALLGRSVVVEPPLHRRVARALMADAPTVFEQPGVGRVLAPMVAMVGRLNLPGLKARVRADLDGAGLGAQYSAEQFIALCVILGFVAACSGALAEASLGGGLLLLVVPIFGVLGFYVPMLLLSQMRGRRVLLIAKQLPYTLDLVSLVMKAGSSFTEAVETLIRDNPQEELNRELAVMLGEVSLGTTRAQAMENLAARVPLESLRSVVSSVNQAEMLGTPLAGILQEQSVTLRNIRAVTAEKKSASASLRILVPSMLIMAAVLLVVFGPMVVRFVRGEFSLG